MKENIKKKFARITLTWAGHAERMGDKKNCKESRCSESGRRRMEKNATDRRNWRLLIENVERER